MAIQTQPSDYVRNVPLQVAAALRYIDANGDPVTQLYPNEYLALVGSTVGTLKNQYTQTVSILNSYNTRLDVLETDVNDIMLSGTTYVPSVGGGCVIPDNALHPITDVVEALVSDFCDYTTVLGTPTALAQAILAQCTNLNTAQAFSQNSVMAGLTGWVTSPSTSADTMNNLWLAYCDARAGITQALTQSAITCADIIINYTSVYTPASRVVTFYFYSSYIPVNFNATDTTSGLVTITDMYGNTYTKQFDLYAAVTTGYIPADLTNSSLSPGSSYNVVLSYNIASTTPAIGCSGYRPGTILNYTQLCPNTTTSNPSNTVIAYTFTPTVTTDVLYQVELFEGSSGTTSGQTALQSKSYVNPTSITSDQFTALTPSHSYIFRITLTIGATVTYCDEILITTSS